MLFNPNRPGNKAVWLKMRGRLSRKVLFKRFRIQLREALHFSTPHFLCSRSEKVSTAVPPPFDQASEKKPSFTMKLPYSLLRNPALRERGGFGGTRRRRVPFLSNSCDDNRFPSWGHDMILAPSFLRGADPSYILRSVYFKLFKKETQSTDVYSALSNVCSNLQHLKYRN